MIWTPTNDGFQDLESCSFFGGCKKNCPNQNKHVAASFSIRPIPHSNHQQKVPQLLDFFCSQAQLSGVDLALLEQFHEPAKWAELPTPPNPIQRKTTDPKNRRQRFQMANKKNMFKLKLYNAKQVGRVFKNYIHTLPETNCSPPKLRKRIALKRGPCSVQMDSVNRFNLFQ